MEHLARVCTDSLDLRITNGSPVEDSTTGSQGFHLEDRVIDLSEVKESAMRPPTAS